MGAQKLSPVSSIVSTTGTKKPLSLPWLSFGKKYNVV
jgi:hypothetical protein